MYNSFNEVKKMENGVLLQGFHWYIKPEEKLWKQLQEKVKSYKEMGFSAIWLPPAYKGVGGIHDNGYGVYDLYDLGEFNQKGSIETKYGTKEDYLACIQAFQKAGIDVYGDIVLNHKMGADGTEIVMAKEVNRQNTNEIISDDEQIEVYTLFTFPGRNKKYSDFIWHWYHFDGIDYDKKTHRNTIFLFDQKSWDQEVDDENGNYDYLMGADLDFGNEETVQEVTSWLYWYINFTKINGLRLDAVKHIPASFYKNLLPKIYHDFNKELFTVGEYWHGDVYHLEKYLKEVNFEMSLFDVPLHYHFYDASHNENYDFSHIFDQTLVSMYPSNAVTFVDNHDTEPSQSLASFIPDWFKGHAYCLTLLRKAGYPCIFYGDLEGIDYENVSSKKEMLHQLLSLRKQYNEGNQEDYFDHLRKDDFLKIKWNEKLFMGKIADSTKALVDAQDVMYWLEKHHVRYIFHGHKHIPCVVKKGNTYIMAGGSSCGGGTRERKSSYLSYNLLKYNRKDQVFKYCFVFYDDLTKQERHRVKIKLFMEDQNEVSR